MGTGELLVIAGIALMVIGPERLPHVMRTMGQYYGQLRRAADDLRRAFVMEADRQDADVRYRQLRERRQKEVEARQRAEAEAAAATGGTPPVDGPTEVPAPAPAEPVPNDIPPDAPHPRASSAAAPGPQKPGEDE